MLHKAAVDSIGYKTRKHQDWFDWNSDTIMYMQRNHAQSIQGYYQLLCILWQQWQAARNEVQTTLRTLQNAWWLNKAQEIQSYSDRNYMHTFYNSLKTIYGPRNYSITPLKAADVLTILKDKKQFLAMWA